jgi:predicted nuclease of predicted toxin-antitoxin system
MRFLADESCDFAVVRALREAGHDVWAVAEQAAGTDDDSVMVRAHSDGRVLLTEDRDFGRLVFAASRPAPAVIYLRYPGGCAGRQLRHSPAGACAYQPASVTPDARGGRSTLAAAAPSPSSRPEPLRPTECRPMNPGKLRRLAQRLRAGYIRPASKRRRDSSRPLVSRTRTVCKSYDRSFVIS